MEKEYHLSEIEDNQRNNKFQLDAHPSSQSVREISTYWGCVKVLDCTETFFLMHLEGLKVSWPYNLSSEPAHFRGYKWGEGYY